ncbi:MAG: DNA polymerase III subunit delta [Ignavibacteriae bacterium]|nr:DNA polymerase III subunit delta [Ignavibacteriota bacterium]
MAKQRSNSLRLEDIERSFREKKFSPLYLFYGEEDFLVEETLSTLIEEALGPTTQSFNLDIVYGSDVDGKDVVSLASAFPMLGDRRVVVVKEFDKLPNKDTLLPFIEKPLASTLLVVISSKPDFRQTIFKSLEKNGTVTEFRSLYDNEVPGWIRKRFEKFGKKATVEACQFIQGYVGKSLREIQNEVDKLIIYVDDKETIDEDDVTRVVGMSRQFNIFELSKAVGEKDLSRSLEILEHMMRVGESPLLIIIMLTRYFQKLWMLQEMNGKTASQNQLAAGIGVSPFFLREYLDASGKYPALQIEQCFQALTKADETLKSTSTDPNLVMTLLVYQLIRQQQSIPVVSIT